MSIRKDKEKLIDEIQKLRALINEIKVITITGHPNGDFMYGVDEVKKEEAQKLVNKIQDIIFNL